MDIISVESRVHTALRLPDGSVIAGSTDGSPVVTDGLDAKVVSDWTEQNKDQPFITLGLVKTVAAQPVAQAAPEPEAKIEAPAKEPEAPKSDAQDGTKKGAASQAAAEEKPAG